MRSFFEFANEREAIRYRRESGMMLPPWSLDPVLASYRFCNVFREDDKVTAWFRESVRDKVRGDKLKSLIACTAFRFINHVPTGVALRDLLVGLWNPGFAAVRMARIQRDGDQLVGGAYLIRTPEGLSKGDGIVKIVEDVRAAAPEILAARPTLQAVHAALCEVPFVGRFMGYEIVTDLRHTDWLKDAPDAMTWASPGPGCARGLSWIVYGEPGHFNYNRPADQAEMLRLMRDLLEASKTEWKYPARPWELREVEHVLCELDKYKRGCLGQRLKRKFSA